MHLHSAVQNTNAMTVPGRRGGHENARKIVVSAQGEVSYASNACGSYFHAGHLRTQHVWNKVGGMM